MTMIEEVLAAIVSFCLVWSILTFKDRFIVVYQREKLSKYEHLENE